MGAFDFFRKYVAPVVAPMIPGVGPYLGMFMGQGGGGNQQNPGVGPSYGAYDYRDYYMPPSGNGRSPTQSYQRTNPTDGTLPGLVPVSSGGGGRDWSRIITPIVTGAVGYAAGRMTGSDRQDPDTGRFDMRSNQESGYGRQDRETARIQAMENPNRPGIGPSSRGKVSYIQAGQRDAIRNQPFRSGYNHYIDSDDPTDPWVSEMPPIYPNNTRRQNRQEEPPPEPEPTPEPTPVRASGASPVRALGPRYIRGIRMY